MLKKVSLFLLCLMCALSARAVTLDVLVVYDTNTYKAYSGNPQTRIASFINWANFAHGNSGTDVQLNLVGSVYLDIAKAPGVGINTAFLETVTNNFGVMTHRNRLKPALTVYITNTVFDATTGLGVCGIAWFPPVAGDNYSGSNSSLKAVSVVGYNCSDSVLAHEVGHNLGAGHGAMDANGNGRPIVSSRGYGVQGRFVDVMAYPQNYGTTNQLMIYSSPNFGGCTGLTCGTVNDNAAGGIKAFAPNLANNSSCYPAENPTNAPGYSWSCKKPCTSTSTINIGLTCSSNACTEEFGRTCYSKGGSAVWANGAYSCQKTTVVACPITPPPPPPMCTYTTNINIGQSCSSSSCAESFGRTCAAAGGSASYTGSYTCKKITTQVCP